MRKTAKRPSLGLKLLRFFFTSASRLAIAAGEFVVRNPVLTGGATAFLVVMSFVSANALWYQPEAHNAVFFRTRTDFIFKPTPRPTLPGMAVITHTDKKPVEEVATTPQADAPVETIEDIAAVTTRMEPQVTDDMLPALAAHADVEVARLQQRLSVLGIYKGPVDGFSGPQTREAIERWRALQKKVGVEQAKVPLEPQTKAPQPDSVEKAIEVAIPAKRPQPVVIKNSASAQRSEQTSTIPKADLVSYQKPASTPKGKISVQDVIRVQAGLKAFGNDSVPVNGEAGKTTQSAVREFQKLFGLSVTGEIDATLIAKMREIGLIS